MDNQQRATASARRAGLIRREVLEIFAPARIFGFSVMVAILVGAAVLSLFAPQAVSHTTRIAVCATATAFIVFMYGKPLIESLIGK